MAGFRLDRNGFKVNHPSSDTFRFARPLNEPKPVQTSAFEQTLFIPGVTGGPSRIRVSLTSPGFGLYFERGARLRLGSLAAPLLSWQDGTIEGDSGLPTPKVAWAVISFRDQQPPVLFAFLGEPQALRLKGKAGAWELAVEDPEFKGWMRVVAPNGTWPRPTNTARELGLLTKALSAMADLWTQPAPRVLETTLEETDASVEVVWRMDRPSAVIPRGVFLSSLAGASVRLLSPTRRIHRGDEEGPLDVAEGDEIRVRFGARRAPTGRALTLGQPSQPFGTASYLDVPSVTELALANLVASSDLATRRLANATYAEFITEAETFVEPATQQSLPFEPSGKGLDLVAAHALLMQSTLSTARATSLPNSLLTSLSWRRDWCSWRLWAADRNVARRASALASIAAALAPEPERRLEGALFEAGLAAEAGLQLWQRRTRQVPATALLEPLGAIRRDLYGKEDYRQQPGFGAVLLSDLRAYGDLAVFAEAKEGQLVASIAAEANAPIQVVFASGYPLELKPPEGLATRSIFGFTMVEGRLSSAGPHRIALTLPAWAPKLPPLRELPRYEEQLVIPSLR